MNLIKYPLTKNQYHDESFDKRLIILHHTVGGTAKSSINWWQQTAEKVGTAIVLDRNGDIYEAFPVDKWASGLGIKQSTFNKWNLPNINTRLDQISIQIELANWGGLTEKDGKFFTFTGKEIDRCNVTTYAKPFKGFNHYESYTTEQLEALKSLILSLNKKYPAIKLNYNEDMWEVSRRALVGTWGIWTHVSFREDKSDCHPQPELILMLKSLK